MDAAGLGLATLDLCVKTGKHLYAICQRYRHADREIRENILRLEAVWLKTESQIESLRDLWSDFDERVQLHQSTVLSLLYEKLQVGIALLHGLDSRADGEPSLQSLQTSTRGDLKIFRYASSTNKKLDKVMEEMNKWQKLFDPSWYLLARAASQSLGERTVSTPQSASKDMFIIQELRRVQGKHTGPTGSGNSVFLSNDSPVQRTNHISNMSAEYGCFASQDVIIDPLNIADGKDSREITKDVRDIARILATVDPAVFGLLMCQGVKKKYDSSQVIGFDVIFAIPHGLTNPRSLRTRLLSADHPLPLDDRFRIARLLARSVSFLHTIQIVHKNISPETIILLQSSIDELETPFLVGFEKFRRAGGHTYMSGDVLWEKNLYRHPQRQGEQPEEMYKMQHDIYSLGVCLLEIGLGISFVSIDPEAVSNQDPRGAEPNPTLQISEHLQNKDLRARAFRIKRALVALAETRLPGAMGKAYTNVVVSCLTCLDPGNQGFGDESDFEDEDGILVGIRYIEKILYSLEEIQF